MYVADLQIDEDNEAEMAAHGVTPEEVWQVWTNAPRYFRNKRGRSATHLMIGPTFGGRMLTVPLAPTAQDDVWRPATAYDATTGDRKRYNR